MSTTKATMVVKIQGADGASQIHPVSRVDYLPPQEGQNYAKLYLYTPTAGYIGYEVAHIGAGGVAFVMNEAGVTFQKYFGPDTVKEWDQDQDIWQVAAEDGRTLNLGKFAREDGSIGFEVWDDTIDRECALRLRSAEALELAQVALMFASPEIGVSMRLRQLSGAAEEQA